MSEDIGDVVRRLARPSAMLGKHAIGEVLRLTTAIKEETTSRIKELLERANREGWPVLYTYMSDGWGCKISSGQAVHVGEHIVRREGRVRAEFLLEKSILKTLSPSGVVHTALRWEQPRGLGAGKTGWHVFQAAVEHDTVLRDYVPQGMVMTFLLQDGLHVQGMSRRMMARQELFYDASDNPEVADDTEHPLRLTDWCFGMRCIAHVASSAISWGMAEFCTKTLLDEIHIGIASCRNSSHELFQVVHEFVCTQVVFQDSPQSPHIRQEFWITLGVRSEMMPEVLRVDPRWDRVTSRLLVSAELEVEEGWRDSVASVLMYFLRFQSFSETRWAGVGPCCRLFLAAVSVGLPALVRLVYGRPGLTTYHLGGYKSIGQAHLLYMTIGAVATCPCEGFNLEIMQDDRFLKRGVALRTLLREQTNKIESLALQSWDNLAELIDATTTGAHLRNMTLLAMHRMNGYLYQEGFSHLDTFPLCLTQGAVRERLADLSLADPGGLDIVSSRIQICLQSGLIPEGVLVRSLELLRETPCSTCLVEKAHGAGSIVRNYHHRLSPTMLCHRALLAQVAPLFSKSSGDAKIQRLRERIDTLQKTPVWYTGMQEYCRRLMQEACAGCAADDPELPHVRSKVIASHADRYSRLPPLLKAELSSAAQLEKRRRVDERQVVVRQLEANLVALLRGQAESQREDVGPSNSVVTSSIVNKLSTMAFDDEAKARIGRAFHNMRGMSGQLQALEREALAPVAPDPDIQQAIEAKAATFPKKARTPPWWASVVARERGRFMNTALVPIDPAAEHLEEMPERIWYINLMSQSPVEVQLLECVRDTCIPALECLRPDQVPMEFGLQAYKHEFKYCSAASVPSLSDDDTRFGVVHTAWVENRIVVVSSFVEFDVYAAPFLASMSAPRSESKVRAQPKRGDESLAALADEFPWLSRDEILEFLGGGAKDQRPHKKSKPNEGIGKAESVEAISDQVEIAADKVLEELQDKRDLYETANDKDQYFYVKLPGGLWTAANKGVPTDCAACLNRRMTEEWCLKYCFPRKKSFMFSLYTEENAVQLANEWVRRGNHYYSLWLRAGADLEYAFTETDIVSYEEDLEWLDFAVGISTEAPAFQRIIEVRSWKPKCS